MLTVECYKKKKPKNNNQEMIFNTHQHPKKPQKTQNNVYIYIYKVWQYNGKHKENTQIISTPSPGRLCSVLTTPYLKKDMAETAVEQLASRLEIRT